MINLKELLAKLLDAVKVDYIVEQGTSGIWTYRKWNSGVCELWGKWEETLSNYSTASPLYGYMSSTKNLPFTVYDPVVSYIVKVGTGFAMPASGMGSIDTSTLNQIKGYAMGTANGSNATIWSFYVKGTWK